MRIGTFSTTRGWSRACDVLGYTIVEAPRVVNGSQFTSTLQDRIDSGRQAMRLFSNNQVDLILDSFGDGLLFIDDPREHGVSSSLHETLGVPLVSFWTETYRILFQGMDPVFMRAALRSPTWHKAIFTRGHLREMQWLGINNCFYLPPAAVNNAYDTLPLSTADQTGAVFFAGTQQSRYFAHADGADTRMQWRGQLAFGQNVHEPRQTFMDSYVQLCPEDRPLPDDSDEKQAEKVGRYFRQKLFYAASLNLFRRDRFVLQLVRELGDDFLLHGSRWKESYGIDTLPFITDKVLFHSLMRTTPLCLNMCNGDNETGLNFRHMEITAAGGCMLSYDQPELREHFVPDEECVAFADEEALMATIHRLLNRPRERADIAHAGQQRTLSAHLMHHRLLSILDHLEEIGSRERIHENSDSSLLRAGAATIMGDDHR